MKSNAFGVLQRVGRSFMLPIAILPVAGLLLGIGSSFTNATTLETYGLSSIIYEGGVLYTILDIMAKTGSVVFDNLALLFAMGVAIGMAKKEKEVAALSGAVAYLIMNTAIDGWAEAPAADQYPVQFEIDYVRYYTKGDAAQADEPEEAEEEPRKKKKKSKKKKSRK